MDWSASMDRERYEAQALRIPPDVPLALMDLAIGLIYALGPTSRESSPAFQTAKAMLAWTGAPMRVWGALFVLVGLLVVYAVHHPTRPVVTLLRIAGPSLFVMWALMLGLSAVANPRAALAGIPSYIYLAYRHSIAPAVARRRPR